MMVVLGRDGRLFPEDTMKVETDEDTEKDIEKHHRAKHCKRNDRHWWSLIQRSPELLVINENDRRVIKRKRCQ